ncbi:hypothetical protein [Nocardioides sp.]|uniref:hypothetical protein n=1 Tax=Nocardioides sp. TaxID=35761 RepID=UPI002606903F|nr:hypothetical protein [Nocardioides sp.]
MRRGGERGAVLPIMAMMVTIVITAAAFAVDLGVQRVARRDMQAVSDVVALDVARLVDGRTRAQIVAGTGASPAKRTLAAVVADSIARNTADAVGSTPAVSVYLVKADATGAYPRSGGVPVQVLTGEVPNAVVVTASTSVRFVFGTIAGVRDGGAGRSALARALAPTLCFSVGTDALALTTDHSALSPLLSTLLSGKIKAVGYDGLVSAQNLQVPLAGLMTNLGVGTVDQLATTQVTISQLALASVAAITAQEPTADVSALSSLLHLPVTVPAITLGSILALTTGGPTSGLSGSVNALDLVTAAVVAASGNSALAGSLLVPGLAGVSFTFIQPPQIACGAPTDSPQPFAAGAQVQLDVDVPLSATAALGVTSGRVALAVKVASGDATLTGLGCTPESATFLVHTGAAVVPPDRSTVELNVTLAKFLDFVPGLGTLLALALRALGLDPVGLVAKVGAAIVSDTRSGVVITYPPAPALPPTYTVSGSHGSVLNLTAADVQLSTASNAIGGVLGSLLNPTLSAVTGGVVTPLLNTVVSPLLSSLILPLLSKLGITLGNTDITVRGRPDCGGVQLIG